MGKIDAKTTKVTWPFPTPNARGRRMNIDDQDRITVTEYRGNKVAVFDTRAEKFTEYDLPPPARIRTGPISTGTANSGSRRCIPTGSCASIPRPEPQCST